MANEPISQRVLKIISVIQWASSGNYKIKVFIIPKICHNKDGKSLDTKSVDLLIFRKWRIRENVDIHKLFIYKYIHTHLCVCVRTNAFT